MANRGSSIQRAVVAAMLLLLLALPSTAASQALSFADDSVAMLPPSQ
jgi:hypothetical protein